MFPLFLKNLSFLHSSSSSQVRKLFTRFHVCEFSSSSSPFPPQPPEAQPPEVFVWWHLDSCPVPSGVSYWKVAPSITAAVRANGIMGAISIRAFGDFNSPVVDKEALNSTNISLYSITDIKPKINTGGKDDTYRHFLMDFNHTVSRLPPPLHVFVIFGNEDFPRNGILHRLRMCNYNILLACPGRAHFSLCHAATITTRKYCIVWEWSSMLKGEDLTGKHFNYPPDGPFNSCYGNSNVPLENPFSVAELHTSSQNVEIYKPSLDIKLGENIVKILCSHPNGITMGDLRAELTKCDLPLGKHFYGRKKFSNFLLSIPQLQLEYLGGGNFWVRLVPSTTFVVKNKQMDGAATQKVQNEGKNMDRSADEIPRISSSGVSSEGDDLKSFQSNDDIVKSDDVSPEILEKINPSQNPYTCNDCTMLKNNDFSNLEPEKDNKHESPTRKEVDEACHSPFTSTFFSRIRSWWRKLKFFFKDSELSEIVVDLSDSHPLQPHWDTFRVSVWWDFDSCGVPSNFSFLNVAPSIMGVLRANGIKGPIHIDAYGDVSQLSEIKQEALFLSGVNLHHIPGGTNKNKCFMDWLSRNPPRGHFFLISGDKDFDFSSTLHRTWLRKNGNFLLACPGKAHGYICKVATIVWKWSSILKGKYLTGKYIKPFPDWYIKVWVQVPLEYPPGWYRNSKAPHENSFSVVEEPTYLQNANIHEPSSYIKLLEVQESVSRQVRKVLSSYPNGISIGDLNLQLRVIFAGGLCGCKKFPEILASIPHVQLLYIGDDNFCVCLIPSTTSNVKKKQWAIKNEQRDVNHSEMSVLFSTSSFWDDVESFVFTSRGSRLLSRSRSREDLAHRLQKHGSLFFMSLTENKILQLVKLLIAEKKWLEESPSQAFPFRLTKSVQKS